MRPGPAARRDAAYGPRARSRPGRVDLDAARPRARLAAAAGASPGSAPGPSRCSRCTARAATTSCRPATSAYLKLVGRLQTGNPRARADEEEVRAFFAPYGSGPGWPARTRSPAAYATRRWRRPARQPRGTLRPRALGAGDELRVKSEGWTGSATRGGPGGPATCSSRRVARQELVGQRARAFGGRLGAGCGASSRRRRPTARVLPAEGLAASAGKNTGSVAFTSRAGGRGRGRGWP